MATSPEYRSAFLQMVESSADIISVDKVSTVVPAAETARRITFLTSCDLVCRSYPYINRIFFFSKSSHGSSYEAVVSLMQEGLSRALVQFYPLAGRFCNDAEGRLQIDCNDGGAEFVNASCELPFSFLLHDGFQHRSLFWKLARRTHLLRCDYLHEPILSVQMTKFADGGGFTVGVSMSHAAADAQSFYDFVTCWGETCRGVAMAAPPKHMRTALSVEVLSSPEDAPYVKSELVKKEINGYLKSGSNKDDGDEEKEGIVNDLKPQNGNIVVDDLVKELQEMGIMGKPAVRLAGRSGNAPTSRLHAPMVEKQMEEEEHRRPRTDLVQKIFSFSTQKLQGLKDKINGGIPANGVHKSAPGLLQVKEPVFTTFEAFCSHWWKCVIAARDLPPAQPVFLLIPINCRQRFLDLPKSYFGNALDGGLVRMTVGELCGAEPPVIAGKIREAIKAATEESFVQYIKEAEKRRNAIPHFDRTGLFHVVDSPKYPVYEINFGFGTPAAVRAEGFRFGAEVQILAGRLGPGSYDMFCALDSLAMDRLEHNPAFLAC